MLSRLKSHLRSNMVAYVALFFALSGTAFAAKPLITGADVRDESLTGADIADQSGVDTCPASTTRLGALCVTSQNPNSTFGGALERCANLDLHMPTLGEALQLALTHDIPDLDENQFGSPEFFWTDEFFWMDDRGMAFIVDDDANWEERGVAGDPESVVVHKTVCVATPTN